MQSLNLGQLSSSDSPNKARDSLNIFFFFFFFLSFFYFIRIYFTFTFCIQLSTVSCHSSNSRMQMQGLSATASSSASASSCLVKFVVRASWDTQQQRLTYNPNAPRKLKKQVQTHSPALLTSTIAKDHFVSDLLKRPTPPSPTAEEEENDEDETYLGYEKWLPTPPKVVKPRSVLNAATLAYIGDCIYELYARRHFLFPPLGIEEYNDRVMALVRCEAQDALLQKLLNGNFLADQERDVLRWGKNIVSSKTKTKKRAGAAVYNRASSLETLVGYLYLTNVNRLEKLMLELGFSVDSSMALNIEEAITGGLNNG